LPRDALKWVDDVCGELVDCGHSIPEQRPDELAKLLIDFFGR
jgi:hypothetical protein